MKRVILSFILFLFLSCSGGICAEKWLTAKATHFIIYYKDAPESFIDQVVDKAEYYYDKIADDLGFRRYNFWLWDNRAKIYVYDDAAEYQRVTGLPEWSQGAAVPRDKIIHTFPTEKYFFDVILPHEMGHIIFRELVGFNNYAVPLWLDEGVASYEEQARRDMARRVAKDALSKGKLTPLTQLSKINPLILTDRQEVDLFYAESLNIVDYLVKEYGTDSFIDFCQALRDKKNLDAAIRSAYPLEDLEELDEAWQKNLK